MVALLHRLLRHIRRHLIMVFWDNGPHHRSRAVGTNLDDQPRLEVHRSPGCSPALNPDEFVRSPLKKHELAS